MSKLFSVGYYTCCRIDSKSVQGCIDKQVDIFEDKDMLDYFNGEVPVMVYIITLIQKYEKTTFLPDAVIKLLNFNLELNSSVRKLSAERFRKAKRFDGREPKTDCFPSLPLHSETTLFKSDTTKTKDDEEEDCNKEYPEAP